MSSPSDGQKNAGKGRAGARKGGDARRSGRSGTRIKLGQDGMPTRSIEAKVKKRWQKAKPGRPPTRRGGLDRDEIKVLVCGYHLKGYTAAEILWIMKNRHGVKLSRQEPYDLIAEAAFQDWFRMVPPLQTVLEDRIKAAAGNRLQAVKVVLGGHVDPITDAGAETAFQLIQSRARTNGGKKDVITIGMCAGITMKGLARKLANLIRRYPESLPKKLVFVQISSAFEAKEPAVDPHAYFNYFVDDTLSFPIEIDFVYLHAPVLCEQGELQRLSHLEGIREAWESVDQLDLLITSGAVFEDEHSLYKRRMTRCEGALAALNGAGIVGDMGFLPLGKGGPLEVQTARSATTVVEAPRLATRVMAGMEVLLVLAPCGMCHTPKTPILESIIRCDPPLVTHLVVDSLTAGRLPVDGNASLS